MNRIVSFFDSPVNASIGVIYALLIFASAVIYILRRLRPGDS